MAYETIIDSEDLCMAGEYYSQQWPHLLQGHSRTMEKRQTQRGQQHGKANVHPLQERSGGVL